MWEGYVSLAGILGREEELTIKRDGKHMREIQQ